MLESNQKGNALNLEKRFQVLEEQVLKAVKIISGLKNENSELKTGMDALHSRIRELESNLEAAEGCAAEVEKWKQQARELDRIKQMVAGKIENLLAQIETLNLAG
ncbi:hypothetical protein JXA40_04785 [bacterium]|nr:hypothetical protein [candidate division CSSED10-310 bacterium]